MKGFSTHIIQSSPLSFFHITHKSHPALIQKSVNHFSNSMFLRRSTRYPFPIHQKSSCVFFHRVTLFPTISILSSIVESISGVNTPFSKVPLYQRYARFTKGEKNQSVSALSVSAISKRCINLCETWACLALLSFESSEVSKKRENSCSNALQYKKSSSIIFGVSVLSDIICICTSVQRCFCSCICFIERVY